MSREYFCRVFYGIENILISFHTPYLQGLPASGELQVDVLLSQVSCVLL